MDEPKHGQYRRLTNDWFKPGRIGRLEGRLDELSRQAVDRLAAAGGSCDFVSEVALPYPLQVILAILGLPEADSGMVLRLTQALFGAEDPDLQRGPTTPEVVGAVVMEFYQYFVELTAQRRVDPTDDLASVIANGRIDGQPLPDIETMSYYLIVATAGHDTTSYAMSGGLRALLEHPAQLEVLRADPSLLNNAVEEMIRWTAPVRHFMRTAQEDTEVAGQAIAAGDWLYLSFTGADFDPSVYDDPLRFDVTRDNADRHLAFGAGVHYCLGAQLARMELRSLFAHLLARVEHIELAESPADSTTTFVGGTKRCPIRYRLTDA